MTHELAYPATLTPDDTDGGFVVTFQDVPEAITPRRSVDWLSHVHPAAAVGSRLAGPEAGACRAGT